MYTWILALAGIFKKLIHVGETWVWSYFILEIYYLAFPYRSCFASYSDFAFCLVTIKSSCFSTSGDEKVGLERFSFHLINNREPILSIMCLFIVWEEAYQEIWLLLSAIWGFQLWGARNNLEVWLNCTERYLPELPFFFPSIITTFWICAMKVRVNSMSSFFLDIYLKLVLDHVQHKQGDQAQFKILWEHEYFSPGTPPNTILLGGLSKWLWKASGPDRHTKEHRI